MQQEGCDVETGMASMPFFCFTSRKFNVILEVKSTFWGQDRDAEHVSMREKAFPVPLNNLESNFEAINPF